MIILSIDNDKPILYWLPTLYPILYVNYSNFEFVFLFQQIYFITLDISETIKYPDLRRLHDRFYEKIKGRKHA